MSLATLFAVPTTRVQEQAWSFSHMAHHRDMLRQLQIQMQITLPEYALDPWTEELADLHQEMHQQLDAALGVGSYDLSDVNWDDPQQRASWILLNAALHQIEGGILGVG